MNKSAQKIFLVALVVVGVVSGSQIMHYVFAETTQALPTCTSFNYSDWSACQTDGTKTRTVASTVHDSCTGGNPALKESCSLCTTRTYLNDMNKDNCVSSRGKWSASSCVCTCPTGYHFEGTGCLYTTATNTTTNTSITTTTVSACNFFSYSDWSSCQTDGTKTRTVLYSYPSGCTGGSPVLSQTCTYVVPVTICDSSRPYLNQMNQDNCLNSAGTWNTSTCVCTCPTGYHFEGTGCLYTTNTSTTSTPTSTTTTTDTTNTTTTTIPTCTSFSYSDWSACQSTGIQTRTLLSSYPTGCTGGNSVLSQSCVYTSTTTNTTTTTTTNGTAANTSPTTTTDTTTTNSTNTNTPATTTNNTTTTANGTTTNTTDTTNAVIPACTSFSYSDWSACQTDGTKTRTITSTVPPACTVADPVLKESCNLCTARTYLDQMDQDNCLNSKGSWNTSTCVCTCPTGYHFEGTGCLYTTVTVPATCTSFVYSNWSACSNKKQTRIVVSSFPSGCTGGNPESLEMTCEETAVTYCEYKFSGYGSCENGKQTRTVLSRTPAGCVERLTESLEKTCAVEKPKVACSYIYSSWSDCTDGKQTRKVVSAYPNDCISNNPSLEHTCEVKQSCTEDTWSCGDWSDCSSAGIQERKCSLAFDCPTVANKEPETSRSCVYRIVSTETVPQNQETLTNTQSETPTLNTESQTTVVNETLPDECIKSGWNTKKDCEIYLQQSRIVSECLSRNLNTQDQCRTYFLSKYGKPLKCQGASDSECNNLISNVILSDLKTTITPEVKQALSEVSGRAAVINTENKTITVSSVSQSATQAAEPQKEIKVENISFASTAEQITVSLVPVVTTTQQQTLSPVAIVFDSNANGVPDDVEKRLASTVENVRSINNSTLASLSGVDQALITGKSLEQPKLGDAAASTSLAVSSVETVKPVEAGTANNLRFQGKAKPGEVVTLFIYSVMPIVVTVKADENGNWVYDLDKTLVDGTHEVYVAINDNQGRIVEASVPTPFFIAQAQAVSIDNFAQLGGAAVATPSTKSGNMVVFYVSGGIIFILFLVSAFLIVRERSTH